MLIVWVLGSSSTNYIVIAVVLAEYKWLLPKGQFPFDLLFLIIPNHEIFPKPQIYPPSSQVRQPAVRDQEKRKVLPQDANVQATATTLARKNNHLGLRLLI